MNIIYLEDLDKQYAECCYSDGFCNEDNYIAFCCYDGNFAHPFPITQPNRHTFNLFFVCKNHLRTALDAGYDTVSKSYFKKIYTKFNGKSKIANMDFLKFIHMLEK